MNQTERDIFYKLLIDLFLDKPGKTPANKQQGEQSGNENIQTNAGGRGKRLRPTNAPGK